MISSAQLNFKIAEFAFHRPNPKRAIMGIMVLIPGSNSDGRQWAYAKSWVKLAEAQDLILCGCHFEDKDPNIIEGYADAKRGSGQALLDAIAKELINNHGVQPSDVYHVPIYLWGFSAGGQFAYEFTCWRPERVGGFALNKGGVYYTALAPKAAREVPGLFFLGKQDAEFRRTIIKGIYLLNQVAGCQWTLVEEDCKHDIEDSMWISIREFDRLMERRKAA